MVIFLPCNPREIRYLKDRRCWDGAHLSGAQLCRENLNSSPVSRGMYRKAHIINGTFTGLPMDQHHNTLLWILIAVISG